MEKLKNLKEFIFDKAQYQVQDTKGNKGLLKVDYKNKQYSIEGRGLATESIQELALFAQSILEKKHGINFAEVN